MKRKNTLHKKKQKSRTLEKRSRIKDKTKKKTRKRVNKKTQSGGSLPLIVGLILAAAAVASAGFVGLKKKF